MGKRLHKFLCRKQHLIKKYKDKELDNSMTENEMTQLLDLYKIWNCGLLKYTYQNF